MNYLKNKCRGSLVAANVITFSILYLSGITGVIANDNALAKLGSGQKKDIAVATRLMLYGKNNVLIPVPMGINFHAKLFRSISMGIGYSFSIDDHLVGVSHSYNPKDPQGVKGSIIAANLRYYKSNNFNGVFAQYTFEIVNWKNYCLVSPVDCPIFDTDTKFRSYSHVLSIGYSEIKESFFKKLPLYTSLMIGRDFGSSVRQFNWILGIELGTVFSL